MANPVFIICSESGSIDQESNLISLFNVIEKITVQKVIGKESPIPKRPPILNFRVTTVWRRGKNESGAEYEYELNFQLPGLEKATKIGDGRFSFTEAPFHRLTADISGMSSLRQGELVITQRIRPYKKKKSKWINQSYEIPVDVLVVDESKIDSRESGEPK